MNKNMNVKGMFGSGICVAVVGMALHSSVANAHGYISEPPSRGYACALGQNIDCGGATYEPQSVGEAPKGFPATGPADGKIASGGVRPDFAPLDEQSASRWHLTTLTTRDIDFAWYYTIGHKSTKWEYFVTKPGWNPNAPLGRESFDLTPFCVVAGNGQPPRDDLSPGPGREKHRCTLPADRTGHHAILGIWTVDDTANAFHDVMDVNIQAEGGPAPEWRQTSSINPHRDLQAGDGVTARAFVDAVENEQYSVSIRIDSAEQGLAHNWSHTLAQRINETQAMVKAGQLDAEGNINPVKGANIIFTRPQSNISGYELAFDAAPGDDAYMHLHDLKPDYPLQDGSATVDFSVMTNKKLQVSATLFDAANQQVGFTRSHVEAGTLPVAVEGNSAAGTHLLKVVGVDKAGRVLLQEERRVQLTAADGGEYDHVFPQGIADYKAGTRVQQPKTGEVFECKPFPFEGWCRIHSQNANQFEPGVGSNWQDAWIKR